MSWLCCGKNNAEVIRSLDYSHSLSNEVPNEIYLYERTLEKLYLDSNRILELPKQLFNCDELRILNISDNEVNFLPPAVSQLINLQKLDISKNAITKIPENIKNCTSLYVLDLSINPIEKFPESVINLVSLKELYLNDIYLEFLPANFGKLINLRILELRENNLSTLPRTINRLVHLTRLDIGNNEFDELPEVVSSLHNLTELWVDGNNIKKLHPSIGQLRKLNHFEASNNKIEFLPSDFGYWTKIVELSLSCNELEKLPPSIGNMKNLVSLKLDENQITELPEALGKLMNLEELMINYNYISELPASIGLLRKLQVLIADRNKISQIPIELGSCTSLSILSLRDNRISEIPAEIGHINSLRVLNLVNNQLRYLPMSLLKLTNLSALWLSNNQSQPLVPLQQEIYPDTYQMVLTCFMLPQVMHKRTEYPIINNDVISTPPSQVHHRRICFANDSTVPIEHTRRLMRAPTPYPKELRALAKHAKNFQRGLTVTQQKSEEAPPVQSALEIKEAKVSTTITNNTATMNIETSPLDQSNEQNHYNVNLQNNSEIHSPPSLSDNKQTENKEGTTENPISMPVLTVKNTRVIRQAKNIRTGAQNRNVPLDIPKTMVPPKINYNQPPPYHIAAQRSQYFNSLDCNECVNLTTQRTQDEKMSQSVNYSKYSIRKDDYRDNNTLPHEQVPLTSDIQNDNTYNDLSSYYQDIKTDYSKNHSNYCNNIQNQNDYEPRTFIQDKPAPSEYIVAPTPKRPISIEGTSFCNDNNSNGNMYSPSSNCTNSPNGNHDKIDNALSNQRKSVSDNSLTSPSNSSLKWAFGRHKNATVTQVTIQKNKDFGFTISEKHGYGIFVDSICSNGPANNVLHVGDKILEVDGVDFTNMNESSAINFLQSSSNFISMMISHID